MPINGFAPAPPLFVAGFSFASTWYRLSSLYCPYSSSKWNKIRLCHFGNTRCWYHSRGSRQHRNPILQSAMRTAMTWAEIVPVTMKTMWMTLSTLKPLYGQAKAILTMNKWSKPLKPSGTSVTGWSINSNLMTSGCWRCWSMTVQHFCSLQKPASAKKGGWIQQEGHHQQPGSREQLVQCGTEHAHAARILVLEQVATIAFDKNNLIKGDISHFGDVDMDLIRQRSSGTDTPLHKQDLVVVHIPSALPHHK